MWLDRRQDPNNHDIGTFEAVSRNDGATWPNRRISTATWNPDNGFFASGAFIGDYSGIAANNQVDLPRVDGRLVTARIVGHRHRRDRRLHRRRDPFLASLGARGAEGAGWGRPGRAAPSIRASHLHERAGACLPPND